MSEQGSGSDGKTRFTDLIKGVRPLHPDHSNRTEDTPPRPSAPPREPLKDRGRALKEPLYAQQEPESMQPEERLSYRGNSVRKNTFRKLEKGHYRIGAELDLHGLTLPEAERALADFIQASREENIRCVLIIHGKGHGLGNRGPKLKPMVNQWLRRKETPAFCSAQPKDGGTGAVYVLLKSLG